MILLIPLMCFIALFFHKLCGKEASDGGNVVKLTDLLERYMFPQSQVMLSTKIGKGIFGTIYKGYAHKILQHESETLVAIKEVKGSSTDSQSYIESHKVDFDAFILFGNFTMIFLFLIFFRCYRWDQN